MPGTSKTKKLIIHILLILICLCFLYPIIIMLLGSFKTQVELSNNPAGLPSSLNFQNYIDVFNHKNGLLVKGFFNSVYISVVTVVITLFLSALAAFAFAKFRFKGRNLIFALLMATMMIPGEVTMTPLYLMMSKVGLLNTYAIQILPSVANVFAMFMLRQYMLTIPDEIIQAARIDGASDWQTFIKVIIPTSTPVLSALGILVFLQKWNEYLWPNIMISNEEKLPILNLIPRLSEGTSVITPSWHLIMTGCVVATLPLIIVFCIFQKSFMASVVLGSVKE